MTSSSSTIVNSSQTSPPISSQTSIDSTISEGQVSSPGPMQKANSSSGIMTNAGFTADQSTSSDVNPSTIPTTSIFGNVTNSEMETSSTSQASLDNVVLQTHQNEVRTFSTVTFTSINKIA